LEGVERLLELRVVEGGVQDPFERVEFGWVDGAGGGGAGEIQAAGTPFGEVLAQAVCGV